MFGTAEPKLYPLDAETRAWADAVMRGISVDRLRANVEALPGPRNRLHSPEAMARADELIARAFSDAGWTAERRPYELKYVPGFLDYEDDGFPAGAKLTIYPRLSGINVVGVKPGVQSADAIVIGAHHDTIRDSPGADDNTASIAALLELARVLGPHRFRDTVVLAAFDMEENGLVGSRVLVPELAEERKIKGAIVYEAMAYTDAAPNSQALPDRIKHLYPGQVSRIEGRRHAGDWTAVVYRGFATALARSFAEGLTHTAGRDAVILVRDPTDVPILGKVVKRLAPASLNFARSDHFSFWTAGIPAIVVTDTAEFRNPHYHLPTDTPDTLDYPRLAAIVGATAIAVARAARLEKRAD